MKEIVRNSMDMENIENPVYRLNIEIVNTEKRLTENRKMNIEKCLFFESETELRNYGKINKIELNEKFIKDVRSQETIVFGHKLVDSETELNEYYKQLENEILTLKKKSK